MTTQASPYAHSVASACAALSIGRTKVYELIAAGELRTIKIGSKTLVLDESIRELIQRRLQATSAESRVAA